LNKKRAPFTDAKFVIVALAKKVNQVYVTIVVVIARTHLGIHPVFEVSAGIWWK
jgi:hypothetical protein